MEGYGEVRVVKVLSEEPWKAEVLERIRVPNSKLFTVYDRKIEEYVNKGYKCYDYASASIQLCIKNNEKIMIGIWLGQIPETN